MSSTCGNVASTQRGNQQPGLLQLAQLWACRLLVNGGGYRALDECKYRIDDDLYRFVGLDLDCAGKGPQHIRRQLRSILSRLKLELDRFPPPLADRLDELDRHMTFDAVEREVLGLMAMVMVCDELREAAEKTSKSEGLDHLSLAACALDRPVDEIEPALRPEGRLSRSGLLRLNTERSLRHMTLSEGFGAPAFQLLGGLAITLTSRTTSVDHLLAQYFQRVALDQPEAFDFGHCHEDLRRLGALIDHALENRDQGVNILIHGQPGVGKTVLTRHLAARHAWDLYSVSACDTEDEFLSGRRRIRACQLCQYLLGQHDRGVLLFDEIEDVFDPRFTEMHDRLGASGSTGKAWTNRLLESNPRPTIWISNDTDMLDPAYLRRFDYIFRLDVPDLQARRRMLAHALEGTGIPDAWIEECAADTDMTPARMAQVSRLTRRLKAVIPKVELPSVLEEQLRQRRCTDQAFGIRTRRRENPLRVYDPDFLNTQPAVDSLLEGLERHQSGSVLMFGPPGSGKTALADFLSERLGCGLVSHSASALLDKFVGETEKGFARMFAEATASGAVLLLDEADNFLSARESARYRWEVTQTNELMVQMERFGGIFLCATNLVQNLDPAVMRRFDVKLEFSYLDPDQSWALFRELLNCMGMTCPRGHEVRRLRERLTQLDQLAPGDFAVVARNRLLTADEDGTPEDVVDQLEAEQRMKPNGNARRPGFL